jgi:uncharacterized protein YbjT (DUF2867 family)
LVATRFGAIREGRIPGPIAPDKKLPHTAARDSAAAAAGLLIDRSWSGQEDVPVLGPEELSYDDLAAIVSEVTGREVRYEHQTYEAYKGPVHYWDMCGRPLGCKRTL